MTEHISTDQIGGQHVSSKPGVHWVVTGKHCEMSKVEAHLEIMLGSPDLEHWTPTPSLVLTVSAHVWHQ